jgi:hypothetical protein
MLIKKLLLLALIALGTASNAQTIKNQATFRTLKAATSLLEAQQFEAAEEYFRKGMHSARQFNDLYCQAFANEGLGNYFAKTEQPDSAAAYYRKAIALYKTQRLNTSALITESLLKSVMNIGDLYAGIEVGARGIKLSVIEIKMSRDRQFEYTLKIDTAINTDAASLSYQSEKESRDAIAKLMDIATNRFNVATKRTYIAVSSGLKQELDKYDKVNYFTQVIRPKNLDAAIPIAYITPEQESELSFMGIVPSKNRFVNNQLDVGSGNTKGGYFNRERKFMPVNFSLGTKSFQRLVEANGGSSTAAFIETSNQIIRDSLHKVMVDELVSKADFKAKDAIYLSGGIVWCIASLLHPESAVINNYTELTAKDIASFRSRITTDYNSLIKPDLSLIKKYEDLIMVEKNITRAVNTYDQKAMLAGAIWLGELVKNINTINPGKKFIFPKYAYVGWISGYIIKKVNQQFVVGLAKP